MAERQTGTRYSVSELLVRSAEAWGIKDQWTSLLYDCYLHGLSGQNPYDSDSAGDPHKATPMGGAMQGEESLDSTLKSSNMALIGTVTTAFFPAKARLATFAPDHTLPIEEQVMLKTALEQAEEYVFGMLNNKSNFDSAIGSCVSDLTTAGTMFMGRRYDNVAKRFTFTPISQAHIAIDIDGEGMPIAYYMKALMTYSEIVQQFGEKPDIRPDDNEGNKKFKVDKICIYDELANMWEYHVLLNDDAAHGKFHLTEVMKYKREECPFSMCRWSRDPDEVYGRSPVMAALATYITLNQATDLTLFSTGLTANPPYAISTNSAFPAQEIKIRPGIGVPVNDVNDIKPLMGPTQLPTAQFSIESMQHQIRTIMLDNRLPGLREKGNHATAEEIVQRQREAKLEYGVPAANLAVFIEDLLRFMLAKLLDEELGAPAAVLDEIVDDLKNSEIRINSPLATDQDSVDAMKLYDSYAALKAQFDPGVLATRIDEPKLIGRIAELMHIPQEFIRTDEEAMQAFQGVLQAGQAAAASQQPAEQAAAPQQAAPVPEGVPIQ